MSNMSYCRFTNTLSDLRECRDNLDSDLSTAEAEARTKLITLCKRIAADYEDMDESEY